LALWRLEALAKAKLPIGFEILRVPPCYV